MTAEFTTDFNTLNSTSAAQEKVKPFDEAAVQLSRWANIFLMNRQRSNSTATLRSAFTDVIKEALSLPAVQAESNDENILSDYSEHIRPKKTEKFRASYKLVGKAKPNFHFDTEID